MLLERESKHMGFTLIRKSVLSSITGAMCAVIPAFAEETVSNHDCCKVKEPGKLVMPSDDLHGKIKEGYEAARKIPEVCCKLFCYCGCDIQDDHTSLLECFVSDHSVSCSICLDEALQALRLKNEGKSITEIQKWIDHNFAPQYPYKKKPSTALKKYRESLKAKDNKTTES